MPCKTKKGKRSNLNKKRSDWNQTNKKRSNTRRTMRKLLRGNSLNKRKIYGGENYVELKTFEEACSHAFNEGIFIQLQGSDKKLTKDLDYTNSNTGILFKMEAESDNTIECYNVDNNMKCTIHDANGKFECWIKKKGSDEDILIDVKNDVIILYDAELLATKELEAFQKIKENNMTMPILLKNMDEVKEYAKSGGIIIKLYYSNGIDMYMTANKQYKYIENLQIEKEYKGIVLGTISYASKKSETDDQYYCVVSQRTKKIDHIFIDELKKTDVGIKELAYFDKLYKSLASPADLNIPYIFMSLGNYDTPEIKENEDHHLRKVVHIIYDKDIEIRERGYSTNIHNYIIKDAIKKYDTSKPSILQSFQSLIAHKDKTTTDMNKWIEESNAFEKEQEQKENDNNLEKINNVVTMMKNQTAKHI